jgi:ribosomal protein S18 acetylase RimI-like enzyme
VDEWERWRELRLESLRSDPEAFFSTYEKELGYPDELWRSRTEAMATAPDRATLVAEEEGAWLGCAGIIPEGGTAQLVGMWTRPEARRRGVGRALVRAALEFAAGAGHDRVQLWVSLQNPGAASLYEDCGFSPTGARASHPEKPDARAQQMERLSSERG